MRSGTSCLVQEVLAKSYSSIENMYKLGIECYDGALLLRSNSLDLFWIGYPCFMG